MLCYFKLTVNDCPSTKMEMHPPSEFYAYFVHTIVSIFMLYHLTFLNDFNICTDQMIKQESPVNNDKHLMYNPVVKRQTPGRCCARVECLDSALC